MSVLSDVDNTGGNQNGLAPHITGNPLSVLNDAPSGLHTMLIIFGALALLWIFGGMLFRHIRM